MMTSGRAPIVLIAPSAWSTTESLRFERNGIRMTDVCQLANSARVGALVIICSFASNSGMLVPKTEYGMVSDPDPDPPDPRAGMPSPAVRAAVTMTAREMKYLILL